MFMFMFKFIGLILYKEEMILYKNPNIYLVEEYIFVYFHHANWNAGVLTMLQNFPNEPWIYKESLLLASLFVNRFMIKK